MFSDVLNYVLRISKLDTLKLRDEDAESKIGSRATISRQITLLQDNDDGDSEDVEAVCVECFTFLKALAKDYLEVQTR